MREKPVGVLDGEPRPRDHGGDAEADADPEFQTRGLARALHVFEFGPVRDDEAREDDAQGRQNRAPGNAASFTLIADVRDDRDEHGDHGHEHARERRPRETDTDREKTVEDDVSEEGKSERLDDVRSGELSQFLPEKEKAGERHDSESDESAQCDEHGVVLRKEKRGDVDEPPERSGGDAEQDT